jgi:hypothetical protein
MSTATRILTGSLATLAVASGVGLATSTAYADAPAGPCGHPAVPAVFATVVSEPVLRQVPAVTHEEWSWERHLTTLLHEYSKVVTPADTTNTWTRTSPDVTELQWSRKVVTQAAQDAVAGAAEVGEWQDLDGVPTGARVEYEYLQQQTGNTRWEAAGWNGVKDDVDHGLGWVLTGHGRQWVVTQEATQGSDAVPEISHLEYTWSTSSPGAEWTQTSAAPHVTPGSTETTTTHGANSPAGTGWALTGTETVPAVVHTMWAPEAPEGYTATEADPKEEASTESSDGTSTTPPPGDGWSKVAGSGVTVVDHEATTELTGGGTEQVLVRPALPATDACPTAPSGTHHVSGPRATGPKATNAGATGTTAAPRATTTVLPATGNPASPLLLTTGLGALLAGGALVRIARRRPTS